MKKLLLFALLLSAFACHKKEEPPALTPPPVTPQVEKASDYLPIKKGGYWIYQHDLVDSNGKVILPQLSRKDSMYWTGRDTMRQGALYALMGNMPHFGIGNENTLLRFAEGAAYAGYMFSAPEPFFITDSLGKTYYRFSESSVGYVVEYTFSRKDVPITVPAGTFICNEYTMHGYFPDNKPPVPKHRYNHFYVAKGIGIIQYRFSFPSSLEYNQWKLQRYKL